mmetsp:Transcript_21376/g.45683  ORF Transcript_21376/g.45683 Transcript_21376/m.45683 type:complete len:349 (+) Transcript_21376:319-1365(+)
MRPRQRIAPEPARGDPLFLRHGQTAVQRPGVLPAVGRAAVKGDGIARLDVDDGLRVDGGRRRRRVQVGFLPLLADDQYPALPRVPRLVLVREVAPVPAPSHVAEREVGAADAVQVGDHRQVPRESVVVVVEPPPLVVFSDLHSLEVVHAVIHRLVREAVLRLDDRVPRHGRGAGGVVAVADVAHLDPGELRVLPHGVGVAVPRPGRGHSLVGGGPHQRPSVARGDEVLHEEDVRRSRQPRDVLPSDLGEDGVPDGEVGEVAGRPEGVKRRRVVAAFLLPPRRTRAMGRSRDRRLPRRGGAPFRRRDALTECLGDRAQRKGEDGSGGASFHPSVCLLRIAGMPMRRVVH